jgi:hypothetical protein
MSAAVEMRLDEAALRRDLAGAPFLLGERDGRWRFDKIEWPYVFIAVTAVPRPGAPSEYLFRFECAGYPRVAATASLWDKATSTLPSVAQWPNGRLRVPSVFRPDWKSGTALYLPCDRVSIEGHDAWRTRHPSQCWSEQLGINRYLEVLSELLNSGDYSGVRSA